MKISTFLPWLLLLIALTGCLQKAATKTESLIGSFSLQAPGKDPANPPDFDNVDAKKFVRFKGTCLNIVDRFQIQFVTNNAVVAASANYSIWHDIPSTAPTDTRPSADQSLYPLNSANYDVDCSTDGIFDFWILISQVESWLGVAPGTDLPIDMISIRGMYGSIPTEMLSFITNSNGEPQQEANTFQFHVGHSPLGTGLCGQMHVYLAYESGGNLSHNVKNSSTKSFTSTFETGLNLNDGITIFESENCSPGTEMASFSFTIPANSTHRKFSYIMSSIVNPMKNITVSTSSFGSAQNKSAGVSSATASSANRLLSDNKMIIEDGRCESLHLLAADYNNTATNYFSYPTTNVTVSLSDSTNFEFRSSCDSGTLISGSARTVTFTNGGTYVQPIYVRAKPGVTLSTTATLTITQDTGQFSNLSKTVYINPPQPVHHLRMARMDSLSSLFNHECYPFMVRLENATSAPVTATMGIDFRFVVHGDITVHADENCSGPNLTMSSTPLSIPAGSSSQIYYWTRSPYMYSASDGNAGIEFDYNSMSPHISHSSMSVDLNAGLTIKPTLSDILNRNMYEMVYWFNEGMASSGNFNFSATPNSKAASMDGVLNAGVPNLAANYFGNFLQGNGTNRLIKRKVYDFTANVSTSAPQAQVSSSITDWSLNVDGAAAIMGAYINLVDLTADSGQQVFINGISNVNSQFYTMTIKSDGKITLEDAGQTVLCSTDPGVITVNNWKLVALKIYREASLHKCQIYVDGMPAGSSGTLPYNLAASGFAPMFGYSGTSMRFEGQMAEIFLDLDQSSNGAFRFSDAVMNSIHSNYFSQRYYSAP